jgi:V-type H+-transporting ATPase subunit C
LQTLSSHFSYLASKSRGAKGKTKGGDTAETFGAEYQALMEEEIFDFVLFEIPWILT